MFFGDGGGEGSRFRRTEVRSEAHGNVVYCERLFLRRMVYRMAEKHETATAETELDTARHFLRQWIEEDLAQGKNDGTVVTPA